MTTSPFATPPRNTVSAMSPSLKPRRTRNTVQLVTLSVVGIILVVASVTAWSLTRAATSVSRGVTLVGVTDFAFRPPIIQAPLGAPMIISVRNDGKLDHDLTILDVPAGSISIANASQARNHTSGVAQPVHVAVGPGRTGTLTFTPTQTGVFQIICSVDGHREAGMTAVLSVKAPS